MNPPLKENPIDGFKLLEIPARLDRKPVIKIVPFELKMSVDEVPSNSELPLP